jgi:hypothetical protein
MNSARTTCAALLLATAGVWLAPARAEVSAEVSENTTYERLVVRGNASAKNLRVWAVTRTVEGMVPLNPGGDLNGDGWPAYVEPVDLGAAPIVVWSRFDGEEYDLAWSIWTDGAGWSDVRWLAPELDQRGPDLDPSMDHDPLDGRAHVVWRRETAGGSEIYLSLFLVNRWMAPYLVSDVGVDARYPDVDVRDDGSILVTYETDAGTVTRVVKFLRPSTITDDLNPLECLRTAPENADSMSQNQ